MNRRQHPTGLSALAAAAVVLLAARFHIDVSGEEAAVIVGIVAAIVSKFTPRDGAA